MNPLEATSPIDGRYRERTERIAKFFSEAGLMCYRVFVEGKYLVALSESGLTGLRKLTEDEKEKIGDLFRQFSLADAEMIKAIEAKGYGDIPATNHDVKAVEYFMKAKLEETSLKDVLEWIHFGLTSEDVNNIAYALMLGDSLEKEIIPAIRDIEKHLDKLASEYKSLPMLARTHGQPATPTTFGKEFKVFSARIAKLLEGLAGITIQAKLNGASGNWNAHVAAYPKADWQSFSRDFIESLNTGRTQKLEANLITTQIECHDSYVAVFDTLRRINTILIGFNQDMWRYISDGWIVQKPKEGEVGSSTMPHKVNPIDFENSEGNLGMANALSEFFARKLPISRLQRDLSDSTVERNFGVALGHSLVAYSYLLGGLGKIQVNKEKVRADLNAHPEVIAEAIQTILRREGVAMPYEKLKALTRGKEVTREDMHAFIETLDISQRVKKDLLEITPENYIGLAENI